MEKVSKDDNKLTVSSKRNQRQQSKNAAMIAKSLAKENKNLNEDVDVLKSIIRRLNKEISFYRDKVRIQYAHSDYEEPVYVSSGSVGASGDEGKENHAERESDAWLKEPRKRLPPLLAAYDETIAEKNKTIKDQDLALDRVRTKYKKVAKENEQLHKIIGEHKNKGTVTIDEWYVLFKNASMVLEQNDLLTDQVKDLNKTIDVTKKTHSETVSKLNTRLKDTKESYSNMKLSYTQIEAHCAVLTEQISKMADMIDKRITREDHESSVFEVKRLFEDLKINYSEERVVLLDKISALEKERNRLVEDVTDLETKNGYLQEDFKILEETLQIKEINLKELNGKIKSAVRDRDSASKTVSEIMQLAQVVVSEREALETSLHEQIALNEQIVSLRSKETELVAELQGRNKIMEDLHQKEMEKLNLQSKELEKLLDSIGDRHREEISNLKELINEKSKRLELIEAEKRQLEVDLGTVWLASKEMIQYKEH